MISYELAKQLKDAGFPDSENWGFREGNGQQAWYEPTLSELISACRCIQFVLREEKDRSWLASNYWNSENNLFGLVGVGSTPEIAVANLYLALKK